MDFKIISDLNQINSEDWETFVNNHSDGNFFQTPLLHSFFSKVENYSPVIIICQNQEGKIVGSLLGSIQKNNFGPFSRLTARTIVWGGPLISEVPEKLQIAELILREFNFIVSKKSIFIQFRNLFDLSIYKDVFLKNGYDFKPHLNYKVNTTDKDDLIKRISKSKWRQIKKGLSNGASISIAESIEEVRTFYLILKNLYKNKIKQPLPNWSFFKSFYENQKLGRILLIKNQDEVIGGIVCPIYGKTSIFEWYICGKDDEFRELYPSILATWAAIENAVNNKIQTFDFLGAGAPDKDYGVREFKSKFGGELVNFGRYNRINSRILYTTGKLGLKFYKRLLAISKLFPSGEKIKSKS